jgi:inosose dehydratase
MSPINRRDFVKASVLSAAVPIKAIASSGPDGTFRIPSQAERGIKVGCSVVLWTLGARSSLAEALKGIAAAGYEWAEGEADYILGYEDRIDEFRQLLAKYRLGWITALLSGNLVDPNQHVQNIGRAVRTARLLQALGADFVTVRGDWGDAVPDPKGFRFYAKQLAEIGSVVYGETGLHCAYHFQERDSADLRKLVALSDSHYVKFCFDTLSLARLEIDPLPMIRTYAERLIHVHLHDAVDQHGSSRDVTIGQGRLDVAALLKALCEIRYDGWVTAEQEVVQHSPGQDARRSRKVVESSLARLGLSADKRVPSFETKTAEVGGDKPEGSPHQGKRNAVRHFAILGATSLVGPLSLLQTASSQSTGSRRKPATAMASHAVHRQAARPVAPLPPKDPNFKPLFFTEDEYRDVSALVDVIIPSTESPGALEARADEFADLMVWSEQGQHETVNAEAKRFRLLCFDRHGKGFADLSLSQRRGFLTYLTGTSLPLEDRPAADFFYRIRGLALYAYYTGSPQGLLQELGYKGNTYGTEFKGCTHAGHQG